MERMLEGGGGGMVNGGDERSDGEDEGREGVRWWRGIWRVY